MYERVGGRAFFARLVDTFYDGVAGDDVLAPLYPEHPDFTGARHRLTLFLVQYWGGPTDYAAERGHPQLRMRHLRFPIGTAPARPMAGAHGRRRRGRDVRPSTTVTSRRRAAGLLPSDRRAPAQRHRSADHVAVVQEHGVSAGPGVEVSDLVKRYGACRPSTG